MLTGQKEKRAATSVTTPPKEKRQKRSANISKYFPPFPKPVHDFSDETIINTDLATATVCRPAHPEIYPPSLGANMSRQLERIERSNLTAFRKRMLSLLCEIPPGRYSTYKALSDHVTATSHKTCARAVGSAMRNNPFAPEVPCHRVLAANGTLGGFGGHWGESGKYASRKHQLLYKEGVRFDSRGKVKGPVFREFNK
nr:methylated-dna--protein-cysteine methyltransferase [Quercus suber]